MDSVQGEWDGSDELLKLRAHDASPLRTERIRARCLAELAALAPEPPRPPVHGLWIRVVEPSLAFGVGLAYVAAAFEISLALLR